jgi:hypothetical protein
MSPALAYLVCAVVFGWMLVHFASDWFGSAKTLESEQGGKDKNRQTAESVHE